MIDTYSLSDDSQYSVAANPKSYPFLDKLGLDQDVSRRLTLHLDRLKVGDSSVYLTPLGRDRDPKSVLDSWSSIFNSKLSSMNEPLVKLEVSNLGKFGPRSIAKPWSSRIESIAEYYNSNSLKINYDILSGLKDDNRGRLRPLSVSEAVKSLKNNTNSGLPYYTKKGKIKERLVRKLEYLLSRRDPCILFTRTQEGDKTRNVWGYPCADTLEEMRYYRPLLSHQSKLSWRSALLGPDDVSKSITSLLLRARECGKEILSGDISSFDANVVADLTRSSFYYIKQLFQYDFRAGLDRICDRFLTIELLTPDGVVSGSHGVPSGSTFTNEVDSIIQYLIVRSLGVPDSDFQIQGDDLVLLLDKVDFETVTQRYESSHLPLNESKSYRATDYCVYLQNLYHLDYMRNGVVGGIYPTYRALNRILYQERWSDFEDFDLDGIDYYSIRTISILENCKHHPLFRDLVEFVHKLDKYSLRYSRKSVNRYDAMMNNGQGNEGFMYNQYSDNIKGIDRFETVKIINELNRR